MYSDVSHCSSYNGVSPFGYSRIIGCLPPPRDFSQATTSFIGSSLPSHPPYALSCFDHSDPDQRSVLNGSYAYLCFRCIENVINCNFMWIASPPFLLRDLSRCMPCTYNVLTLLLSRIDLTTSATRADRGEADNDSCRYEIERHHYLSICDGKVQDTKSPG